MITSRAGRSLAERLWLGFGSVIVLLLLTLLLVQREQSRSTAATDRLEREVRPRSLLAAELERQLLRVGIDTRGYLLAPSATSRQALDRRLEETKLALRALSDARKDADGAALFEAVQPAALRYVTVADSIAQAQPVFTGDVELVLSGRRDEALALLRRYSLLQQRKMDTSLTIVAESRQRVSRSLQFALFAGVLGAAVAGFLTTRSLRSACKQLLDIAHAFERGDWNLARHARRASATSDAAAVDADARDEFARLGHAFYLAGSSIEYREQELAARGQVAEAAASSLAVCEIAQAVLPVVAAHVNAAVAVLHAESPTEARVRARDEPTATGADGHDRAGVARAAWPAVAQVGLPPVEPATWGVGLPGRAWQEARTVVMHDIPADSEFRVRLGYDDAPPRTVASVPLSINRRVIGVMTFASLGRFDTAQLRFLEAVALQIAVGLQHARTFTEVQMLLGEVSRQRARLDEQHQALQAQNEELQAQFEEIQAQAEEIQAQNEELQAQQEEITKQNATMVAQTAALVAADEHKNRFLALLAHELRNPLAAIANGVYLLSSPEAAPAVPLGEEQLQRTRAMISRQTRQLTRLVDDLLDVTRIAQGKLHLERTVVDLCQLVTNCVSDQKLRLEQKGVMMEVAVPATPLVISGDQARLTQLIDNLIDNAIKYTPDDGTITVTLSVDDSSAVLAVRDTGIGIDAAVLPHLFQPFVQADPATMHAPTGLGLGLSLVRAHAELHGGRATIHSDGADQGTTAIVTLPLAAPRADDVAAALADVETLAVETLTVDTRAVDTLAVETLATDTLAEERPPLEAFVREPLSPAPMDERNN